MQNEGFKVPINTFWPVGVVSFESMSGTLWHVMHAAYGSTVGRKR
jgi:hypothetical protein